MNSVTSAKRSKAEKSRRHPGRPKEHRLSQAAKGIVQVATSECQQFEEHAANDSVVTELLFQYPLHLKCISNTIRQIDKSAKLHFVFLPDQVLLYYGDVQSGASQNKCFLRIKCQNVLQYYFNF